MSHEKLKDILLDLISQETCQSYTDLCDDCRLETDLWLDSLGLASLQIRIEDAFGFEFDPINDDFEECFYSFGSLCRYIADRCGVK